MLSCAQSKYWALNSRASVDAWLAKLDSAAAKQASASTAERDLDFLMVLSLTHAGEKGEAYEGED